MQLARQQAFAPASFTLRALPQTAEGDFDGDGRPDVATIRDTPVGRRIQVGLSGSSITDVTANVTSLLAADVDHDGDLDLVAVSRTGRVQVWINDGHGRFTRTPLPETPYVAGEGRLDSRSADAGMAMCAAPVDSPEPPCGAVASVSLVSARLRSHPYISLSLAAWTLRGPPTA